MIQTPALEFTSLNKNLTLVKVRFKVLNFAAVSVLC